MTAAFTQISDIDVRVDNNYVKFTFNASAWGERVQRHTVVRAYTSNYACCGMRSMENMDVFRSFQDLEFWTKVVNAFNGTPGIYYKGGNLSFVLNERQKTNLREMLQSMRALGKLRATKFHNHNMNNYNTMYIWTFGRAQHGN